MSLSHGLLNKSGGLKKYILYIWNKTCVLFSSTTVLGSFELVEIIDQYQTKFDQNIKVL